jgi:predicted ATPase
VGDEVAARAWAAHDRVARSLLRNWHGREIGRTDGFLLLFDTCDDALGFAWDYHDALSTLEQPFAARVGVHYGPVVLRENSPSDVAAGATPYDVDGLAVPTAARIMSLACGGQTLFSAEAAQALTARPERPRDMTARGHWRLKGLEEPIELIEVSRPGRSVAPPEETSKAYRVLRRDGLWVPSRQLPHNLGVEPDLFVGRDEALRRLSRSFDDGARLVTLLGIGGIGKTRLAQRYARGWLGNFAGGAWFCDLSSSRGIDGLTLAVAQALGTPLGAGDPVAQLTNVLVGRGECLLVLDNFEQVAQLAPVTLDVWRRGAPDVRFLVTSREALGLAGEQVQVLDPLFDAEAQSLFKERMQAAGLPAPLDSVDLAALPELVKLLDRLPLAIELAAARTRVIPPADQVRRMGERFRLLAVRGGRPDRQATMRATLDWSWELLDPKERAVLAQLSVFEGGFTLAAAEAVIEGVAWLPDLLQSLVEKSLVRRLHARRFDLLRTVQDFAAEHLQDGRAGAVQRHAAYFATLSENEATAEGCVEIENVVMACRRATAAGSGGAADHRRVAVGALVNAWAAIRLTGPVRAALELARPLAACNGISLGDAALVQRVLGAASGLMGMVDDARASYSQGIELARQAGRTDLHAQLECLLADLEILAGRLDVAAALLDDARATGVSSDPVRLVMLNTQGQLAMARSMWSEALSCFNDALALARTVSDLRWQGGLHGNLGRLALVRGESQRAREHLLASLKLAEALGDKQWAGNAHCNLGFLLYEMGELREAQRELLASLELARALGHRRLEATSFCNLGLVLRALGESALALTHFENAVQVAATSTAPVMEGQFRGYFAEMLGQLDRIDDALTQFERGERLLSESGDSRDIVLLLCQRATVAARFGKSAIAGADLARAERYAAEMTIAPGSELACAIDAARRAVS